MATKNPIVSVVLDKDIDKKLREISKEKGISVSKLVNSLLSEALYLEENVFKDEIYKDINWLSKEWKDKLPVLFTKVLDTTPDPIWIKDKNLRYIYVNKAFENLFGKKREQFIGKSDIEILPPENAKECVYTDMLSIEKGGPSHTQETIKANGKEIVFDVIKTPIIDKNGNLIAILGLSRDITNIAKVNEELEKRNKALEEAYEKLKKIYEFDYLTGFYNRGKFIDILEENLTKLREGKITDKLTLFLIDICNLEHANELYGFYFGDNVIKEISKILQKISPTIGNVVFGRISGRSFAMLAIHDKDVEEIINIISNAISTVKVVFNDNILKFSPKLFFTVRNLNSEIPLLSSENLLFCVESTMEEAKENDSLENFYIIEKGRVETEDTLNKYVLLLDSAVKNREISIKKEDIYNTKTNEIEFLNIIGGISDEQGNFVDVIEIYKSNIRGENFLKLNQLFLEYVKTNIYPQLETKAFLDIGAFIMYDTIFPESEILKNILYMKDKVIFTVCESVITDNKKGVLSLAKDYNISLAINNIGFGNTSLKNMMEFADMGILQHIKFYPAIFKNSLNSEKEKAFIKGVVSFAKGMGIRTIITNIETQQEYDLAKELGIDYIHGSFIKQEINV